MIAADNTLRQVLANYTKLGDVVSLKKIDAGLINKTYLVDSSRMFFILQEVSRIFDTTINDDSEAVSLGLTAAKIRSPKILRTDQGQLFCATENRIFRALEYISGHTFHKIGSDKMAYEAGRVVGEFHAALENFTYTYKSLRPHGGNYGFHTNNLTKTLKLGETHDYFVKVNPLAQTFLNELTSITADLVTTPRHAHGDPKISNILFNDETQGICLIDFDTLSCTGWSLELADAMRSWCNKNKEDVLHAKVDLRVAEFALTGYGQAMAKKITPHEIKEFVVHTKAITLCLATRYLADVITENYFAYDRDRFERAADHNLLRAQAMFNLFNEFKECGTRLESMAQDLLL